MKVARGLASLVDRAATSSYVSLTCRCAIVLRRVRPIAILTLVEVLLIHKVLLIEVLHI